MRDATRPTAVAFSLYVGSIHTVAIRCGIMYHNAVVCDPSDRQ